jgi:anti-sigma-K factor RskA
MTDVHALSGAYAVDALDDLERAKFERHLSECQDCQEEVASLREASALLADLTAVTPPPSLRDSVLAGITTVRPIPPVVAEAVPAKPTRRRWTGLLVAAAAVTVLGSGAVVVQQLTDDPTSEGPTPYTVAEQVLRDNDAKRIVQEFRDGSKATVVVSRKVDKAVIVTERMAAPPAGSVYQLWYQYGTDMVPAGVMPIQPDVTKVLDGDARDAEAVGISVEPEGTSPEEPTTDPIAVFSIPT